MADFTAFSINEMIDWLTGVASPVATGTRYITTFNGNPQAGGTENINTITGSSNRIAMTASMGASSGGAATNTGVVTFTASAAGSATVDYTAIYDAITGGNLLASTAVTSKSVQTNDSLSIAIGDLDIAII